MIENDLGKELLKWTGHTGLISMIGIYYIGSSLNYVCSNKDILHAKKFSLRKLK